MAPAPRDGTSRRQRTTPQLSLRTQRRAAALSFDDRARMERSSVTATAQPFARAAVGLGQIHHDRRSPRPEPGLVSSRRREVSLGQFYERANSQCLPYALRSLLAWCARQASSGSICAIHSARSFSDGAAPVCTMLFLAQGMAHDAPRDAFRHFALSRQGAPQVTERMHSVAAVGYADLAPQEPASVILKPTCAAGPLHR